MKTKFDKKPICEKCRKGVAISFSYFDHAPSGKHWRFCCSCTDETEKYYVKIDSFFSSAASTIDWLAHLHEKDWVDWRDFMNMMDRFRDATGSYSKM